MSKVFLGLGSNKGDRILNLSEAVNALDNQKFCDVINISSLYESHPYGPIEQADYLNMVVELKTGYSAGELFEVCKGIEKDIGRTEAEKWGPREIDIDILLFDNIIYKDEFITIPHKDILKRDFVLYPLNEINSEIIVPGTNKKVREYLNSGLSKYIFNKLPKSELNIYGKSAI